jgi:hypothetical protein
MNMQTAATILVNALGQIQFFKDGKISRLYMPLDGLTFLDNGRIYRLCMWIHVFSMPLINYTTTYGN